MQNPDHDEEPDPGGVRAASRWLGSAPSPDVLALLAQVDHLLEVPGAAATVAPDGLHGGTSALASRRPAGEAGRRRDPDDEHADPAPAAAPEADPVGETAHRIPWPRALALLLLGCLALGAAAGLGAFATGFYIAALIEPHDVLLAVREALCGTLLLGAGVSTGLGWAVLAAVGYEAGAHTVVPDRRKAARPRFEVAPEVVPG